jgi:hypothetical protein
VLRVPIANEDRMNVIDKLKMWFTLLFSNALAKCCAPSALISFDQSTRDVSVYDE